MIVLKSELISPPKAIYFKIDSLVIAGTSESFGFVEGKAGFLKAVLAAFLNYKIE